MVASADVLTETMVNDKAIDNVKDDNRPAHWFKPGNQMAKRGKRGKQRLTTAFINDLEHEWLSRGCQALQELDGKALVQACIAILPKDVLVTMDADSKTSWVINAAPISIEDWKAGLDKPDKENPPESAG